LHSKKLSLMKMKVFLRTERPRHRIINAHGYNPVAKPGIYYKPSLSPTSTKTNWAVPWLRWLLPVTHYGGPSPLHVGFKSTKLQQDRFISAYFSFPRSVSFYKCCILINSPINDTTHCSELRALLNNRLKHDQN
jgi:hypothetical protein